MTVVYVDGGCSQSNQKDIGKREMIFAVVTQDGDVLAEARQPGGSNNLSELLAVREALRWAKSTGFTDLEIRTDSRNNFAWVAGKIGESVNDYTQAVNIYREIATLRQHVNMELVWVGREENEAGIYLEIKRLEAALGPDVSAAIADSIGRV